VRKCGLAEAGRAVEQQVVEGLVALLGGVDSDTEVILQLLLADKLVKAPGTKGDIDRVFFLVLGFAGDDSLSSRTRASVEYLCY
jgi:hypothetical protein